MTGSQFTDENGPIPYFENSDLRKMAGLMVGLEFPNENVGDPLPNGNFDGSIGVSKLDVFCIS